MNNRWHRTPWGDWVDLSRMVSAQVMRCDDKKWHVVCVIATMRCVHEVWSNPHDRKSDARACLDAFMVTIPGGLGSPYRTTD